MSKYVHLARICHYITIGKKVKLLLGGSSRSCTLYSKHADVFLAISGCGWYEFFAVKIIFPFEKEGPGGILDDYPLKDSQQCFVFEMV
jgi:hypothetical protein